MVNEVRFAQPPVVLGWDGRLRVTDLDGRPLERAAAEVLMALGGQEPAWLALVEALLTVESAYPGNWEELRVAAEAMTGDPARRAQMARTTPEPAILLGLAALGEPQVVKNPGLTSREWDALMAHRKAGVAVRARNIADVLPVAMADHPDPEARVRVARNPLCSTVLLSHLADDPADAVRRAVAANPNTKRSTLRRMLRDKRNQPRVWEAIATNKNIPRLGLEKCLRLGPDRAREAAVANPRLPDWRVATLVLSRWSATRRALAGRPDARPGQLSWVEAFSRRDQPSKQNLIRARVISHPNVPGAVKARSEQLNAYMKSPDVAISPWLRLAPPSPFEALILFIALGLLATTVVTLNNIGAGLFACLLAGAVAIRCRTVRPGTKVAKPRGKQVPTDRRLAPTDRRNLYNRILPLAIVVSAIIASAQSNIAPGNPAGPTQPSSPTTTVTFPTLPGVTPSH